MAIGHIGSWWNPIDDVEAAASAVADVVTSAIDDTPGVSQLAGLIGDAAKTSIGKVVTRALAGSLYMAAVPLLGPQLASVAFVTPEVIAGNSDFADAYATELAYRVDGVLSYFAPEIGSGIADAFSSGLSDGMAWLSSQGIDPKDAAKWLADQGIDVQSLAKSLGIREDSAQAALDGFLGQTSDLNSLFDPTNGAQYGTQAALRRTVVNGAAGVRNTALATLIRSSNTPVALPSPASAPVRLVSLSSQLRGEPAAAASATVLAPRPVSATSPSDGGRSSMGWDLALGGLIVAAGVAVAYYFRRP